MAYAQVGFIQLDLSAYSPQQLQMGAEVEIFPADSGDKKLTENLR